MTVKRYDREDYKSCGEWATRMAESEIGDWVRYEDHAAAIPRTQAAERERCMKAVCHGCAEGWPYRLHRWRNGNGTPEEAWEHDPEGRQAGWLPCTAVGIRMLVPDLCLYCGQPVAEGGTAHDQGADCLRARHP